ncbi:MAG TPA: class I SAM-dependent methyltransferase [Alphaproteobacteria bacterium]|nr:class I SAM-dependent methyltransferase [Alphaproteobacteria bacterium]
MIDFRTVDSATKAKHLGNPEGELGLAAGEFMNASNAQLHDAAFRRLGLEANQRVLEVGFGNGKLSAALWALAPGVGYSGVDISATMVAAANDINRAAVAAGEAEFLLGACERLPFEDRQFDRAVTVNTIYFWPDPSACLGELRRVLKPGGLLLVASMDHETAARYPFAEHGFRLYDGATLKALHEQAGFRAVEIERYRETIPAPKGTTLERGFYFTLART